jgi:hypothetical protein
MTVFPAHHKKSAIKPLIVALWLASPSFIAVAEDSPPLMEPPFLEAATEQANPNAKTPPPAQNTVTNGLLPVDQDGQTVYQRQNLRPLKRQRSPCQNQNHKNAPLYWA